MPIGIVVGILFIAISLLLIIFLLFSSNQKNDTAVGFKNLSTKSNNTDDQLEDIDFVKVERNADGQYTLKQKMIYANWHFPPILFYILRLLVAFLSFVIATLFFTPFLSSVIAFIAFAFVNSFLKKAIDKRFKSFDNDYPTFLQTIVSLLKSGMNVLTAIDSAADGLEDNSLLKQEVKIMMQRLKAGVGEEKAIGNFGSTIDHPEIELFIQTIILGKSLGGSLSMTLDRLAEQVRKRQYFRSSAVSSIAQQKGSVWAIIAILASMIIMIAVKSPALFEESLQTRVGRIILEGGIAIILFGIYWIKKIINIKV